MTLEPQNSDDDATTYHNLLSRALKMKVIEDDGGSENTTGDLKQYTTELVELLMQVGVSPPSTIYPYDETNMEFDWNSKHNNTKTLVNVCIVDNGDGGMIELDVCVRNMVTKTTWWLNEDTDLDIVFSWGQIGNALTNLIHVLGVYIPTKIINISE